MLFVCSLYDAYSDEMGVVDFGRSQNGSGMASQSQVLYSNTHFQFMQIIFNDSTGTYYLMHANCR